MTLPRWTAPVLVLLSLPVGLLTFFVLWAGLNWSWTQLYTAIVTPRVMEPPCQQRARCQFGVRQVVVDEGTWAQAFQTRELGLFLLDGALLFVCLCGAILGTVQLGILTRRGWTCLTASTASPPPPASPGPRQRRPQR